MKNKIIGIFWGLITLNLLNPLPSIAQIRDRNDFFRQGDQQLEEEIQRMQNQKPETPLLTIQGNQQNWQAILFEEAGFSLWMPSGTFRQEMVEINSDAGTLDFPIIASHLETSGYLVGYSNLISEDKLTNPEPIFNQIRDGFIKQTEGELIQDNSVSFEQYAGREIILDNQETVLTVRIYLIKQRFYILGVSHDKTQNLSNQISAFFQSFKLVE